MKRAMIIIDVSDNYETESSDCKGCPYDGNETCRLQTLYIEFECPKVIKEEKDAERNLKESK